MMSKKKGNVLDRFEAIIKWKAERPQQSCLPSDIGLFTEKNSYSITILLDIVDISYSKYFPRRELLKAEKAIGLEAFAREQISIGMTGIKRIVENNPFKNHEDELKAAGEYVATYNAR